MRKKIELELEFPDDFVPPEEFDGSASFANHYTSKCDRCPFYVWNDDYAQGDCVVPSVGEGCPLKKHFSDGEKKDAPVLVEGHEPLLDRETFEQVQKMIKARMAAKLSTPSTATKKPQPAITYPKASKIPPCPPLGYKWQDGVLVMDEAEAELVKRGYSEMAERGRVSTETQQEIRRALRAKLEAWRKEHPTT